MDKFVLGCDGGGTKTQCALYDIYGNEVDLVNWGPTNHEVLKGGFQDLKSELRLLFNYILKRNNIHEKQIVKSVFGMAGVDTAEQHRIVSGIIMELGIKDFSLCNDAYLGIKAGCREGYGIGVVNGTGCCVAGIDHHGRRIQIGGQGNITGDLGGGVYIGERFIQTIYNYYFRCGEYSCMVDMIPEMLKVDSKYSFIDNLLEKVNQGVIKISDLNVIVFDAANKGDACAVNILSELGKNLATAVNGIFRELDFVENKPVEIILAGSVMTKGCNATLINALKEEICSKNHERIIEFKLLDKLPVIGAVICALEDSMDRDTICKIFFNSPMQIV